MVSFHGRMRNHFHHRVSFMADWSLNDANIFRPAQVKRWESIRVGVQPSSRRKPECIKSCNRAPIREIESEAEPLIPWLARLHEGVAEPVEGELWLYRGD